jgi:nucleotide-binding universal stress UspA family protein
METNILLAFDGSEQSLKALDEGIRVAKGLKAKLIVLHVYWGEGADAYIDPKRITTEDVDIDAQKMYGRLEERFKKEGVTYEVKSERSTDVPLTITGTAEKMNSEMIVIGNRGVGRVRGFLLGSVAEKVVASSKCSVLLVK